MKAKQKQYVVGFPGHNMIYGNYQTVKRSAPGPAATYPLSWRYADRMVTEFRRQGIKAIIYELVYVEPE